MVITRDSGSGTRNGFMNSLCIDPSWGVGENTGAFTRSSSNDLLGENFTPSNKGGSSRMEGTTRNHRLAIGHTGAERGIGRWLDSGQLEILAVINDVNGTSAAQPVRPFVDNILFNSDPDTGWQIGGPETFSTIGDPGAESIADGGLGNGNEPMQNPHAAAYLNNIRESIALYAGDPGLPVNDFTPGEFLADNFILNAALDAVPNNLIPCQYDTQSSVNTVLQGDIQMNSILGLTEYELFGQVTTVGIVPTRSDGAANAYADGAPADSYVTFGGTPISYGTTFWGGASIETANRVSGDFNVDGLRDLDDAERLYEAWDARTNGAMWTGNPDLSPEIVGDFNGDGFFDRYDLRYWADGLAIDPMSGNLDREAGFAALDAAAGGNFFGTTLMTGAYDAGDSRADIANGSGIVHPARGFAPVGAEGYNRDSAVSPSLANMVDAHDIEYVQDQIVGGPIDWRGALADAAEGDLSADIDGNFCIDRRDVSAIVEGVLDTDVRDVNLDGVVDAADVQVVNDSIAMPVADPKWTDGDLDGDDDVDADDLAIAQGTSSFICAADLNGDGATNGQDLVILLGNFGAMVEGACLSSGDVTGDGVVNGPDLVALLGDFGCN
jgi:hypothetical protein